MGDWLPNPNMDDSDNKKETPETTERVTLSIDNPVDQRKICTACYERGRADAFYVFVVLVAAVFIILKGLKIIAAHVTE